MMKIYTKGGDKGFTSLAGGSRIKKSSPVLEAYGTLDELNSSIGMLLTETDSEKLELIQSQLFTVAGMLATEVEKWSLYWKPEQIQEYVKGLEEEIDSKSAYLTPLKSFILPRGTKAIVQLHLCRTVCRRAERIIAGLAEEEPAYLLVLEYVNRLSDFFFILARYYHHIQNVPEIYWKSEK